MEELLHHHPNDGCFRPECKRCKVERAAPKLLEAYEKYGCHLDDCNLTSLIPIRKRNGIEVGCTCGWDKLVTAIASATSPDKAAETAQDGRSAKGT